MPADARERLDAALAEMRIEAPPEAAELLLELCEVVAAWAQRVNLTAHRTADAVLDRLVVEALALSALLPPAARIADLGAGAGFPGLPLAILRPESAVTLVEARQRKHHFQREAIRRLGLGNVRALHGRAEALPPEPHELVVAQAMAAPDVVLPLLQRWAAPGATLVLPGGPRPPEPKAEPGLTGVHLLHYRVPGLDAGRTLWIGRQEAADA